MMNKFSSEVHCTDAISNAVAKLQNAADIMEHDRDRLLIEQARNLQYFRIQQTNSVIQIQDEICSQLDSLRSNGNKRLLEVLQSAFEAVDAASEDIKILADSPLLDLVQTMGRIADTLDKGGNFPNSISGKVPDLVDKIREEISKLPNSLSAGIKTINNVRVLLTTEKRFDVSFFKSDFDAIELELLAAIIEQKYQGRRL